MRLIGRLFLLFSAFALIAWAVWAFALRRPDMQRELYERAAEAHYEAARPRPVEATAFRATACGEGPCVLVEAGGLAILVGAGAGAADGLHAVGLLRANLDGVLLTSLQPSESAGLADLALALRVLGRTTPLVVHGPPGVERVVEALNAVITAGIAQPPGPDGAPAAGLLVSGPPGVSQAEAEPATAVSGGLVFDSGVVAVRRFDLARDAAAPASAYRIDFDGLSLIAGGCAARGGDIAAAARGATRAFAVIPAASAWMLETQSAAAKAVGLRRAWAGPEGPEGCLSGEDAMLAFQEAKLAGGLLAPLYPQADDPATIRLWRELAPAAPDTMRVATGIPGSSIDLRERDAPAPPEPAAPEKAP